MELVFIIFVIILLSCGGYSLWRYLNPEDSQEPTTEIIVSSRELRELELPLKGLSIREQANAVREYKEKQIQRDKEKERRSAKNQIHNARKIHPVLV